MERKKRTAKRSASVQSYEKRKKTTDTVRHYILYPVVPSTIQKSNDFYFHALQLLWNDRNIFKDSQCKKLFQGLHWNENEVINFKKLSRAEENGWFTSSRQSDLATIGKIAGYFLRRFATSVGKALDVRFHADNDSFIGAKDLNDLFEVLRDKQTIIPAIVKLDISPHSKFDQSKFICLTEDVVNILHDGEKVKVSRQAELLKINAVFHERAWHLLNSLTNETRHEIMEELISNSIQTKDISLLIDNDTFHLPADHNRIDGVPINALEPLIAIIEGPDPAENENCRSNVYRQDERRPVSSRLKERNRKYSLDLYVMK